VKKLVKIGLAVIFCTFLITSAVASPKYKDGDWQLWNDASIKGKINDRWSVYVEEEVRWGDGMSQFYYEHTHAEVDFKILEWLTIGPAMRIVYELNSKEVWYPAYEPQVNFAGKWKILKDWTFEARARFQESIYDEPGKKDIFVNRDKFTLKSPWKFTPLKLNPYISDEIFFKEGVNGLAENRLWVGLGMEFFKNLKGELAYIWREIKQTSDNSYLESNILQANLKFEF
jgi:hypothetical protein